ncbi:hypothetical protein SCUP234_12676 [Seiridium cupressi]
MSLDSSFSTSNLGEPEPWSNRKPVILGLIITFLVSSWLCVLGRLYVRARIVRDAGWDDLLVLLYAIVTTSGSVGLLLAADRYGLGQHFILLTGDQMKSYLKTYYIGNASYCTATALIKEALLLQYLRVYGRGHRMWRITVMVAVFTALWGFAYSFIAWVPCIPVKSFWENPPNAICYGYGSPKSAEFAATYESHTAINMILDLTVLAIPLPLLFRDGTAFKQRMRILGLLFMGSMVIMLAIWRLATIIDHQAATWPTHDPTWYGPISIILAVLEIDCAAICASIPIFWPVLEDKWGSIFITQEIKVTREHRYLEDDDQVSLRAGPTGSDVELKRSDSGHSEGPAHYNDVFIMRSVDPLRSPTFGESRNAAVIKSEGPRDAERRWGH